MTAVQTTWSTSTLCSASSRAALISASTSTSTLVGGHTLGLGRTHFLKELNNRNNPIFNKPNAQLRAQTIHLASQATTPMHLPRWAIEKCRKHQAPQPYRPHDVEVVDRRPHFELERLIVQLQSMRTEPASFSMRMRRAVAGSVAAIAAGLTPSPRPKPKCDIPSTCHIIPPAIVVTPPDKDVDPCDDEEYAYGQPAFANKAPPTVHLSLIDSDSLYPDL